MTLFAATRTRLRPLSGLTRRAFHARCLLENGERGLGEVGLFFPRLTGFRAALGFWHEPACHESGPGNIQK